MTATEAAASPRVIAALARASGADKRTVVAVLSGESPYSVVWEAVAVAAGAQGVDGLPEPAARKVRDGGGEHARIARLVDAVKEERRRYAKLRAFAVGLVRQLRDADAEVNRFQSEAENARLELALVTRSLREETEGITAACPHVETIIPPSLREAKTPARRVLSIELDGEDVTPEREAG